MELQRTSKLLGASISFGLHCLAFTLYFLDRVDVPESPHWHEDLLILLAVSTAASVVLATAWAQSHRVVCLLVKIYCLVVVVSGSGSALAIPTVLVLSFVSEISFYFTALFALVAVSLGLGGMVLFLLLRSTYSIGGLPSGKPSLTELVLMAVLPAFFAAVVGVVRWLLSRLGEQSLRLRQLNESVMRLTEMNTGFLQFASEAERRSVQDERTRLTRELHDVIGQTFTNITMMMDAVIRNPLEDKDELQRLHQWVRDHTQVGLMEIRSALYELRGLGLEKPRGVHQIRELIDTFQRVTGIAVHVEWGSLSNQLGPEAADVVYKIIREAMVNSFRHGRATTISIAFWFDPEQMQVTIRDNGKNSTHIGAKGIGQSTMEERLQVLHGRLTLAAGRHGYVVRATVPAGDLNR